MADYFTHFSCLLDVGTPENATLALDLYNALMDENAQQDPPSDAFLLSIQPEHGGSRLWIRDDVTGDPQAVVIYVLRCAEAFDLKGIWGFHWANTCSRPRIDAFGGGAHAIDLGTRKSIGWVSTNAWLAIALDGGDPDA